MGGDYHTINRLLTRRVAPAPEARGGGKAFLGKRRDLREWVGMLIFMLREPTSARDSEALPSNTHYGMVGGSKIKGYRWRTDARNLRSRRASPSTETRAPLRPFLGRKFRQTAFVGVHGGHQRTVLLCAC
jgi:hypothetical protein